MPTILVNGVRIYCEKTGESGDPLVLVHGSWGDHHNWDNVVPELAKSFRVITYDRRGHSASERSEGQGSILDDAADLAALIDILGIAPAHVVGNSGGSAVALHLAAERPDVFRTLVVHEPALIGMLARNGEVIPAVEEAGRRVAAVVELLARGQDEAGARLFVETIAFGPGAWNELPPELRHTFVNNAPTFLDETRDADWDALDLAALGRFTRPSLVSYGTTSAPFFPIIVKKVAGALPNAELSVFDGAGHVPHVSHPREYVEKVRTFIRRHAGPVVGGTQSRPELQA